MFAREESRIKNQESRKDALRDSTPGAIPEGDTIVALSTPPGAGLRAVVRLSGPRAVEVGAAVPGAVVYKGPRTYTREDLVEIHLPGSPPLVDRLLRDLCARGARPAKPGEFTLRAFLNGRLDLAQAEAVEQLISAEGEEDRKAALDQLGGSFSRRLNQIEGDLLDLCADAEAAIDFVDQDIEVLPVEEALKRGGESLTSLRNLMSETAARKTSDQRPTVALHGLPNAGKSALFNALSGADAIVSDVAGTTRDVLTADVDVGFPIRLIDAPGEAEWAGLDGEAVRRSRDAVRRADLILFVVDAAEPAASSAIEPKGRAWLRVTSKADLPHGGAPGFLTSAKTGEGLPELRREIARL
ncbi:MAG TPA: GTPase, partial [Planctomycetota bacterium]|nr:GTPase [Planctomycetota bacterium]